MTRNRWLLAFSVSLLVPALILTGCGGKKKAESSSDSQPTQTTSNAQATRPAGATAAANSGGGGGDAAAGNELATVYANFVKAKSWRANVSVEDPGAAKQQGAMEYVAPNKYHFTLAGLGEFIQIGTDTYVKTGPAWVKSPDGSAGELFSAESISETLNNVKNTTKKGGTDNVGGTRCQLYTVSEPDGTTDEVCSANGLPVRLIVKDGTSTVTILFSDFDKVSDIKAPI